MSELLVSVIVPIYNAGPFLEQCLDSIVGQTHKDLEILLLNDGSTDDSLATMQRYAAQDGRIKVIDKQNQGYGATCNRGLKEATGTWISIVEPDDWIEPGMYADMLAFAEKFTEQGTPLDIAKTPYWRIAAATRTASTQPSSRSPSPMRRICCATTRPSGRPSTASRSWTRTTSASRKSPAPAGPTTPSW